MTNIFPQQIYNQITLHVSSPSFYHLTDWGSWSPWRVCTVTCGGGNRTRVRYCTNPYPLNGGRECLGTNIHVENCAEDTLCPSKYYLSNSKSTLCKINKI